MGLVSRHTKKVLKCDIPVDCLKGVNSCKLVCKDVETGSPKVSRVPPGRPLRLWLFMIKFGHQSKYKGIKMARSKQESNIQQFVDVGAFILSLWFVYSVINNARDLIEKNIKNAPASYGLILALLLVGIGWYQRNKLTNWNIVTLSVLATAVTIWLFGLSA